MSRYHPSLDQGIDPNDDDNSYCQVCGHPTEWESCWSCFGTGEHDLYDQDPIYYDEGDTEWCDVCRGEGGWHTCTNLPHEKKEPTL